MGGRAAARRCETALPARVDVRDHRLRLHRPARGASGRRAQDATRWSSKRRRRGHGCSSRNGGQVSIGYRPTHAELRRTFGRELADRVHRESFDAFDYLGDFIEREEIDCAWRRVGRFHGAHLPSSYEALAGRSRTSPRSGPSKPTWCRGPSSATRSQRHLPRRCGLSPARFAAPRTLSPRSPRQSRSHGRTGGDEMPGRSGGAGRGRVPAPYRPRAAPHARRRGGDQRLYRSPESLAPPTGHSYRQLRDRDRADRRQPDAGALPEGPGGERQPQGGLLLSGEP